MRGDWAAGTARGSLGLSGVLGLVQLGHIAMMVKRCVHGPHHRQIEKERGGEGNHIGRSTANRPSQQIQTTFLGENFLFHLVRGREERVKIY